MARDRGRDETGTEIVQQIPNMWNMEISDMSIFHRSIEIMKREGLSSFFSSAESHIRYKTRKSVSYLLKQTYKYQISSRRTCSICGWNGLMFLPFSDRYDALCPECDTRERHRLIWEYIQRGVEINSQTAILYFAPVQGLSNQIREMENTQVISTDLSRELIDVKSDITSLPFRDSAFDIIICSHVLEHVPDDNEAIEEIYRVLSNTGEAIILVPQNRDKGLTYEDPSITTEEGRKEAYGQANHVRWYGRDVSGKLAACGLDVSSLDYTSDLEDSYVKTHALKESPRWKHDHSRIFSCRKIGGGESD